MHRKRVCLIAAVVLTGFLLAALSACGGAGATEVKVSLKEWSISPGVAQVKPGKVRFVVTNDGKEPHEFVILKSDLNPDALPVVEGKVDEAKVEAIDEIEAFGAGETEKKTVDLKAVKYIFICNIVERPPGEPLKSHYLLGMRTAFAVSQ